MSFQISFLLEMYLCSIPQAVFQRTKTEGCPFASFLKCNKIFKLLFSAICISSLSPIVYGQVDRAYRPSVCVMVQLLSVTDLILSINCNSLLYSYKHVHEAMT